MENTQREIYFQEAEAPSSFALCSAIASSMAVIVTFRQNVYGEDRDFAAWIGDPAGEVEITGEFLAHVGCERNPQKGQTLDCFPWPMEFAGVYGSRGGIWRRRGVA